MLQRDWVVMFALTLALLAMGIGRRSREGRVSRPEGMLLMLAYFGYTGYLVYSILG